MNNNGEWLRTWKEAAVAYWRCITDRSDKVNDRQDGK
jgi:hypothetical protein